MLFAVCVSIPIDLFLGVDLVVTELGGGVMDNLMKLKFVN